MKNITLSVALVSLSLLVQGCSNVSNTTRPEEQTTDNGYDLASDSTGAHIRELSQTLATLGPDGAEDEARRIASAAVLFSRTLALDYRSVSPPIVHNMLVNAGLRDRGLCVHWTEDLLRRLQALRPEHFDLIWAVAHYQSSLPLEHSSVVVIRKGGRLEDGIVLDAWRGAGELFFTSVRTDEYPWKEHFQLTRILALEK